MASIRRGSKGPRLELADHEVWLLSTLIDGLAELIADDAFLSDGADSSIDADGVADASIDVDAGGLADIEGIYWPDADPVQAPADPALARLLPDAYRDDPEAAAEFRRFTDTALREAMRADIVVVRAGLTSVDGRHRLGLDDEQSQAWLRVLTELRLVLAARLGIERASDTDELDLIDHHDPRYESYQVFGWLGYLLSELLDTLV